MSHHKLFFVALIVCLFAGFSFGIITKKSDGSIQIYPETPGQSIVISANGNVGIATENPTEQLTVSGFVKATGFIGGSVSVNGTVTANSFAGSGANLSNVSKYKFAVSQFDSGTTTKNIVDTFCDANSWVQVEVQGIPKGLWSVVSQEGSFTITTPIL